MKIRYIVVICICSISAFILGMAYSEGVLTLPVEHKNVQGKIDVYPVPDESDISYFIIHVDTEIISIGVFDFDMKDYWLLKTADMLNLSVAITYHTYQYSASGTADWLDDIKILDTI